MVWTRGEKMDEYHMARRVLMAEVEGRYGVDGCECGHGQQTDDGKGCVIMCERSVAFHMAYHM